ncbi:MAG: hypothetical protein KAJ43_11915, partial [Gemmatimonadetes bacterium]|nr:hypothetical protein [Gemmatimonadota bacterium]
MTEPNAVPRHLLSVWNPSYADDAMDRHLEVMLRWAAREAQGEVDDPEVYVWWAKLRSPNRDEPLAHKDDLLALQAQIDAGVETHLYLTDYRSLYAGHLVEVTDRDVPGDDPDELGHMPSYYQDREVDCWFRLADIRRLIAGDGPATNEELRSLLNVRYHHRPVSIYGGMIELPLVVERQDGATWFADSEELTGGRRWVVRDSELRGETERLSAELRDNLLGQEIWEALHPTSRTFLTTGEAVFRSRRDDPGFDFSPTAVEYCKAIETELNAAIFPALQPIMAPKPASERVMQDKKGTIDLGRSVPRQTIGSVRHLLIERAEMKRAVAEAFPSRDAAWLAVTLPAELEPLLKLRNPAAHDERITR